MIIMGAQGCMSARGGAKPAGERHWPKKSSPRIPQIWMLYLYKTQICSPAVSLQDSYSITLLWSTEELEKQSLLLTHNYFILAVPLLI